VLALAGFAVLVHRGGGHHLFLIGFEAFSLRHFIPPVKKAAPLVDGTAIG
jgi:hypothetical protein